MYRLLLLILVNLAISKEAKNIDQGQGHAREMLQISTMSAFPEEAERAAIAFNQIQQIVHERIQALSFLIRERERIRRMRWYI